MIRNKSKKFADILKLLKKMGRLANQKQGLLLFESYFK